MRLHITLMSISRNEIRALRLMDSRRIRDPRVANPTNYHIQQSYRTLFHMMDVNLQGFIFVGYWRTPCQICISLHCSSGSSPHLS